MHGNGHDDDNQHNDDTQNETHSHLHVLPPHVLSDAVGAPPEALGTDGKVVCFVFDRVQPLASFGDLVDVIPHDPDGVVNLLKISKACPNKDSGSC